MRSDILCQQLREDKARKRVERKRKSRRVYMRAYRKQLKAKLAVVAPSHPTLTREEIRAVEEAAEYGRMRDNAHLFAPGQAEGVVQTSPQSAIRTSVVIQPDSPPVDAEQRERSVAAHLKELELLKYGPLQPEQKITLPPLFDYPNGIIR